MHECVTVSGVEDGIGLAFIAGSTAAITTVEYEPGLVKDLEEFFDKIAPVDHDYHHEQTWHDGNGHAHVRASLVGPSIAFPVSGGRPVLGTWQQLILIDFDNKPRSREVFVKVVG